MNKAVALGAEGAWSIFSMNGLHWTGEELYVEKQKL